LASTSTRASVLVAVLVGVKLVVTAWNCIGFNGHTYDTSTMRGARRRRAHDRRDGLRCADLLPAALLYKELKQDQWRAEAAARAKEREATQRFEPNLTKHPKRKATALSDGDETPSRQRRGIERTARSPLLDFLRWTNIFYVGAFYLMWIYGVLPRVLPDWNRRLPAALLILALPATRSSP